MASRFLATNSSGSNRVDKGHGSVGWQNNKGGDCTNRNSGSDQHLVIGRGQQTPVQGYGCERLVKRRAAVTGGLRASQGSSGSLAISGLLRSAFLSDERAQVATQ
ncbi:hypothetical protein NL676_008874 [Syzygium grande]|nr:hypothetical protein NL676_008874 [Syzygium grande]